MTYVAPGGGGVGGLIPDNITVGNLVQVNGNLEPYCDSYNKDAAMCATPLFPEFIVNTLSVVGNGPIARPMQVDVSVIEDGATPRSTTPACSFRSPTW